MVKTRSHARAILTTSQLLLCLFFVCIVTYAGVITDGTGNRVPQISGGSDGAGSLPFVGPPTPHARVIQQFTTPTPGVVVDAQRLAVPGTLVIVTHPVMGVVAQTYTNGAGEFVVDLPALAQLELALPSEAIAGIDITAGVPVIVILP